MILVVDDEPVILRLTSSVLGGAGYRVLVAEDAVAGLACFGSDSSRIGLVLADIVMPQMSGIEMVQRMRQIKPGVPVIFMSGYANAVAEAETRGLYPLIRKPFLPQDLLRRVRESIGEPLVS